MYKENQVQKTNGGVYCPTFGNGKCVYIQPIKRQVSTTVKSSKPAATFRIFLLRSKNRQLCCLAVTVHIDLPERRVAITKKRIHLLF